MRLNSDWRQQGWRAGSFGGHDCSGASHGRDFAGTPETPRQLFHGGPDAFNAGIQMAIQRIADEQSLGESIDDMRELTAPAGTDGEG